MGQDCSTQAEQAEEAPDYIFPPPGEEYEAVSPNPDTLTPPPCPLDCPHSSHLEPDDSESVSEDSVSEDSDSDLDEDTEPGGVPLISEPPTPETKKSGSEDLETPTPGTETDSSLIFGPKLGKPGKTAGAPVSDTFKAPTPDRQIGGEKAPKGHTSEPPTPEPLSPASNPKMAPSTPAEEHQVLMDTLDIGLKPKPFKNPNWKPSARRNKSIKQILSEQARREASVMATQNNSGTTTPALQSTRGGTPSGESNGVAGSSTGANITQASRNLSTMVRERNMQAAHENAHENANETVKETTEAANDTAHETLGGGDTGPVATYTNIEAAPSLQGAKQPKYCDITGLPAPYTDPKTGLHYHNKEVFQTIRSMPSGAPEQYLAARNANVILK